jgi:hypothetical protein
LDRSGYPLTQIMDRQAYDPSLDRQELNRLLAEFSATVHAFCDHQPLLRGSLRKLVRRCGKLRCRCTRGQPHRTTVFVDCQGKKLKLRKVDGTDYRRLLPPTTAYRKLRHHRARLSSLLKETLRICDRLTLFRLAEGQRVHSPP